MSDVTCRLVIDHLAFLESQGIPTDVLRATLTERWRKLGGPEFWLNPKNRLAWNDFTFFCRELERVYTPELMLLFVERTVMGPSHWIDVIRPLLRLIVNPMQLYSLVNIWLGPWAFRNVVAKQEKTSASSLHISLDLRPEDEDCAFFFKLCTPMFEQMPRIIGSTRAVTSSVCTARSGRYLIILPPRQPLRVRLRRRLKSFFFVDSLFHELAAAEGDLHVNSRKLLETQSKLEQAVRDRTYELERANKSLSEQVRAMQKLEQIAHLGSWEMTVSPQSFNWSNETYRIFGIDPGEPLTVQLIRSRIHPEDLAAFDLATNRSARHGEPINIDHRIVLPDGTIRHVEERGEVVKDAEGKVLRVIGTVYDQTLQKRYEKSLISAKEASDDANRTKTTFLANVSHEIRTPMSSVLGFAELLTMPDLPPEKHRSYVDKILRNGRHLLALIDDVLDLSKIEAGHLIIHPQRFSLQAEITQAMDLVRAEADKKGVKLTVDREAKFPSEIVNDPIRFRQILINLVGNAIKFTDRGEVKVVCKRVSDLVEIRVEDSGTGIDPKYHAALFQPFSQAKGPAQPRSGSGLGLALARRLARALGGDVTLVKSELGAGSIFSVRIASQLQQNVPQGTLLLDNGITVRLGEGNALAGFPKGAKILVAEDNKDIQEVVRRVLEAAGAEVTTTDNGKECLKAASERRYDLVLMDMQMPELDGFETTARLRQDGYKEPIVALTAFAMSGERQKCFAAGCNDFLAKPVESLLLIKTVAKWLKAPVV